MARELPFRDRGEAGDVLAGHLKDASYERPLVLGVPRGGVIVAVPVASALGAPLDVVVVRKVGAPGNPELALGAVGSTGDAVVDDGLVVGLGVGDDFLAREVEAQRAEAGRRERVFRGDRPPLESWDGDVLVVDDGIATGRTVEAAAMLLRPRVRGRLVLAVPVAPPSSVERLASSYDEVVCPHTPEPYMAVGQWYLNFNQVTDEEVRAALGA